MKKWENSHELRSGEKDTEEENLHKDSYGMQMKMHGKGEVEDRKKHVESY